MANLKAIHSTIKVKSIQGRYITNDDVFPFLEKLEQKFVVENIGISVLGKTIKSVTFGTGVHKIFMWSQMHGNESTTTKAVLDLLNFMSVDSDLAVTILEKCTIKIIPILNPDGAEAKPATVSFLAPAHDEERSISETRGESMQLIVAMNQELQKYIPGQVGRYDDGFNANCVGDTFQMLNKPTILFESGHFPEDYEREETRALIFCAILKGVRIIAEQTIGEYEQKKYFEIPENGKLFYDILIKNIEIISNSLPKDTSVGILFKEQLVSKKITFIPKIEKIEKFDSYFGHVTYNCLNINDLKKIEADKILYHLLIRN
mgnify:CR=1 FL=1